MTAGVVCVDANFVVYLVSSDPPETRFRDLWDQWQESEYRITAPALIYFEVSNSFHRLAVGRLLLPERASQFLEDALNLNITLYSDAELHQRALTLARQLTLPATYDAHYLALAQRLGAEFWTADRRLVQAVQATLPWVNLVG
jgi:predicted nucleic acid-binding protein